MSYYLQQPELFNQPILLSAEERKNPLLIIEGFFCDHALYEVRDFFYNIEDVCLTTDRHPFCEPEARSDFLTMKESTLKLVEAIALIYSRIDQLREIFR
jgi:hypothetical protein